MASVNKVIIVGNCGRDPEVRYMPDGKAVANISIATTSKRKDQSRQVIEDTQWHRVTFYDRLAEIAGEYLKKGGSVYVEGRLKYGTYKDKTGVEKPTCDIVANEMQLLGGRGQSAAQKPSPIQRPSAQRMAAAPASGFDDFEDTPF
jgi:single-strand DNA-binding protein